MNCKICGDAGILPGEEGKMAVECQCAVERRLAASMPPEIRRAPAVRAHFQLPLVQQPKRSLYVRSSLADMKCVIKAVMMTHVNLFVRVTSDMEILNVSLGKKSRASRNAENMGSRRRGTFEDESNTAAFESIEDLVSGPALCIVKLNELSYKNKSAPGYLEEALSYRLDRDRPTWVFCNVDKPFMLGSPAYSPAVYDLMQTTLGKSSIPRIVPRIQLDDDGDSIGGVFQIDNSPKTSGLAAAPPPPARPRAPAPVIQVEEPPVEEEEPKPARTYPSRVSPPRGRIRSAPDDDGPTGTSLDMFGGGLPKKPFRKD